MASRTKPKSSYVVRTPHMTTSTSQGEFCKSVDVTVSPGTRRFKGRDGQIHPTANQSINKMGKLGRW